MQVLITQLSEMWLQASMVVFYKLFEDIFVNTREICSFQENSKNVFCE